MESRVTRAGIRKGAHTAAGLWSCVWGHQAGNSCTLPLPSPGTAVGSAACCAGSAETLECGWSVAVEKVRVRQGTTGPEARKEHNPSSAQKTQS